MSSQYLRKLSVLGPAYVMYGEGNTDGARQSYATNRSWILDANADSYVRLWAPWNKIFPNARGIDAQGNPIPGMGPGEGPNAGGGEVLTRLDHQIASACKDSRYVILTAWGFP